MCTGYGSVKYTACVSGLGMRLRVAALSTSTFVPPVGKREKYNSLMYIHPEVSPAEYQPVVEMTVSALQKCKGYYILGVVISVASVQRVLLYPHDCSVQT